MTFALFVGAGNIIFPPIVGLQSGPPCVLAALGFLITAVGRQVITVIAPAKVGGSVDASAIRSAGAGEACWRSATWRSARAVCQ
ncbi:branched-chain amino acid transport system II carrier protein [Pseudomonas aeruginosa]